MMGPARNTVGAVPRVRAAGATGQLMSHAAINGWLVWFVTD